MNLFNRLVVTLLGLLMTAGGGFLAAAAGGWVTPDMLAAWPQLAQIAVHAADDAGYGPLAVGAAGAAAALLGVLLVWLELRSPRSGSELVIWKDKVGTVNVSLHGLRRLSDHVIAEIPGVEAVVSHARASSKGVSVRCRVVLAPEAETAEVVEQIRVRLAGAVRTHVGKASTLQRVDVHAQVGALTNGKRRVR